MTNETTLSIYEEVIQLGIEHDNHYSDLYIPVNEITKELIERHPEVRPVSQFINQGNGTPGFWYDIAFQYTPFWDGNYKS